MQIQLLPGPWLAIDMFFCSINSEVGVQIEIFHIQVSSALVCFRLYLGSPTMTFVLLLYHIVR